MLILSNILVKLSESCILHVKDSLKYLNVRQKISVNQILYLYGQPRNTVWVFYLRGSVDFVIACYPQKCKR